MVTQQPQCPMTNILDMYMNRSLDHTLSKVLSNYFYHIIHIMTKRHT